MSGLGLLTSQGEADLEERPPQMELGAPECQLHPSTSAWLLVIGKEADILLLSPPTPPQNVYFLNHC